ncbi:hypothetical protein BDR06DRAFT_981317 [Suillus hirtellus]|nr:hypothetical protein BDR06DRAFT_981317 [Suillus hirtellus]
MKKLKYHWTKDPKGQFIDGHERDDVRDGDYPCPSLQEQKTVVWWHDNETAMPYVKGEGQSQMVADLVSADYRWLQSPDGKEEAHVFFKAGKNHEGYFTNQDILEQAQKSMDILEKYYTNENHILVFDNTTTHLKCTDGTLSARNMPKGTSKAETNWGVEVNIRDAASKQVYGADSKLLKGKIQMSDVTFADGSKQSLYFSEDAGPKAGLFKGMAVILHEFSTQACWFMDAYQKGLNGKQAAWASKKYRGHRVLPDSVLRDLDGADVWCDGR